MLIKLNAKRSKATYTKEYERFENSELPLLYYILPLLYYILTFQLPLLYYILPPAYIAGGLFYIPLLCSNEVVIKHCLFMAKTDNKDVIQSYILTTAKYDFSVYEKRILYRLVELNQHLLEGKKLNKDYRIESNIYGDKTYTIPISAFLKEGDASNHKEVKKALEALKRKELTYEDDEIWASLTIIAFPKIKKYNDTVTFSVDNMINNALMNFSKGYKKFELQTAMNFESIYAMRFYEVLSGQKTPITYTIERLKEIFQITNKYTRVSQFQSKVLDAAKKELDRCSPYTFDYKMNKTGRKFTSVTFFPRFQPQFRDTELEKHELQKQVSLSWDLPKEVTDYLIHNFEFTKDGIKNNIDLFKKAHEELDLIQFLASLKGKIRASSNPQGYVVGALKKQLY